MFKQVKKEMTEQIDKMLSLSENLFIVNIDKDHLWELYLESFPADANKLYIERREHDCNACKQFIKKFGNVIAIQKDKIISIWDFIPSDPNYQSSIKAMADYIHEQHEIDIFLTNEQKQGCDKNYQEVNGEVITWEHFYYNLPKQMIKKVDNTELNKLRGNFRDTRNVFLRSINEISIESVEIVLELIDQNSLYKGEEWKAVLEKFYSIKKESLDIENLSAWSWPVSMKLGPAIGRIRNHSIGVLLQDISNNIELDEAVKRYEKIVAPSNYKRPKAIFTEKMILQAKEKINELGFLDSLERRHARIEDITVNNILFANTDTIKKMKKSSDVFESLSKTIPDKMPKISTIEEIPFQTFITEVLPKLTHVELFMENRLEPNLVSLIAPENSKAPSMFKWNNAFSWAYNGNITDSMKQRVQKAGGNVDGVLRFSIMWNENNDNNNDFDAHAIEPNENHIYFSNRGKRHRSSGMLDVDITQPFNRHQVPDGGTAVENIIWTDLNKMPVGEYYFFVHNYSHHGGKTGFTAEIEFNGTIHQFNYNKELRQGEKIPVAKVILSSEGVFTIKELLKSTTSSKTLWNMTTQKYIPVSTIMYSPNYWDNQNGIGHRHLFFMLNNCLNETDPNGFFNEFLSEKLLEHKKVFEALGSKMKVNYSENQLSGVGFSTTKRNHVILKVSGNFNRVIKVNF